jgi:hypothetical protein
VPRGPKGEKRPADVNDRAVMVALIASDSGSLHLFGATQPGQLGDVGRDPPSLIMREYARMPRFVLVFAEIDIGERLAVRVGHDERLLKLTDGPVRGEAAGSGHGQPRPKLPARGSPVHPRLSTRGGAARPVPGSPVRLGVGRPRRIANRGL